MKLTINLKLQPSPDQHTILPTTLKLVAGTGESGCSGDAGPANEAMLQEPNDEFAVFDD